MRIIVSRSNNERYAVKQARWQVCTRGAGICAIVTALLCASARAQAADSLGWLYTAKLTAVWVGGNSVSNTFGLGSTLLRRAQRSELKFDGGAVRTESATRTRRAVGSETSFDVEEETDREKTAETYLLRSRYDRRLSERFVVFTGVDWLRNTFAGIDSRLLLAVGAGNSWVDRDDFRFKTDYGLTYTFQQDVVENPFIKTKFPGVRFAWDLSRKLTNTTRFSSVLTADLNIDDTDDVRMDFTNGVSIAISSALALQPSYQVLWRNAPALTDIELFNTNGTPTGRKVLVPLQKTDSFFTVALVVTL
jgi:putative salt-induced outer membrane protein YdiY